MDENAAAARTVPLPSAAFVRPSGGSSGTAARPDVLGTGRGAPATDGGASAIREDAGAGDGAVGTAAAVVGDDGRTGDDAVDEALTRLEALGDAPLREHVAVFDAVHGALQDRLADTEG